MRWIVIAVALLALSSPSVAQTVENVGPEKFQELIETGDGIILDVRTPKEIVSSHIGKASFINLHDKDFEHKVDLMQKDKPTYVYCKGGGRSAKAAKILIEQGFSQVYNLNGGIMAWERAGLEVEAYDGIEDYGVVQMTEAEFKAMLNKNEVVLVDFHTQWCSPCRAMAPVVDQLETEFQGRAGVRRIDLDQSKAVGEAYDIKGVPVFVVFKNGEEVWRTTGKVEKSVLREALNKAL